MPEQQKRKNNRQRGNALIYVLIAIALFAALSFVLGKQTDTGEVGTLSHEKAEIYSTQLMDYSSQVYSVIEQMMFSGSASDQLLFTKVTDGTFNAAPVIHKVYHPEGGGLIEKDLSDEIVTTAINDPNPGWYLGRFNNVEWTDSTTQDVVLVAYQIKQDVCARINERLTGSAAIPKLTTGIRHVLIDEAEHSASNADFTVAVCGACDGMASLCVQNDSETAYGYYSIIVGE